MPTPRRTPERPRPSRRSLRDGLNDDGLASAVGFVVEFAQLLQRRAEEQAARYRIGRAGPREVEEAWDQLMRPARRAPLWQVLLQEFCVLLAGAAASAAGGVLWYGGEDGTALAAALALAAVASAVAAGVLRAGQRG